MIPSERTQARHIGTVAKACLLVAVAASVMSGCGSAAVRSANPPASAATLGSVAPSLSPSALSIARPSTRATASPSVGPTITVEPPFKPLATIAAPGVIDLASDGTALWAFTATGGVARLDPSKNRIGAGVSVDPAHMDGRFAANDRGLWLNDFDADLVYRVDPASLRIVTRIASPNNPEGIAVDPKNAAVWVANHRGGTVSRIDPATNKVVATIELGKVGPSGPHQVGMGLGSIWVGVPNMASVDRIDPATNKVVATIEIPSGASPCSGFAFGQQAVWTPSCHDSTKLVRIDPTTNGVVATTDLGGFGDDPIIVDGAPWLVVESGDVAAAQLVRIDPATNAIDRIVTVGDSFRGANLVVADGSVWVVDSANARILRLPLTAFST